MPPLDMKMNGLNHLDLIEPRIKEEDIPMPDNSVVLLIFFFVQVEYENWDKANNQPYGNPRLENCGYIKDGKWYDANCDFSMKFICEQFAGKPLIYTDKCLQTDEREDEKQ